VDLAAVITRIRSECSTFSNRVAGASELPAARRDTDSIAKPSAWVIPGPESATQNMVELGALDRIAESFTVIVALSNETEPRGQTSSIAVEAIRDELRAGLIGWNVDSDHLPTQYVGGDLADIDRSTLWYEFTFQSVRIGGSMVEWSVKATLYHTLDSATVLGALETALDAALSGTRLAREVAIGRIVIPQNSTRYRMIFGVAPWVIDSNEMGEVLSIELTVIRHLGAAEAEQTYTEGNMLTQQLAILDPSFWAYTSTVEVKPDQRPELSLPIDPAA
jgi:hypothetical protein